MPARCSQLWLSKMLLVVTSQVRQAGGAQELEMNAYRQEECEPSSIPTCLTPGRTEGTTQWGENRAISTPVLCRKYSSHLLSQHPLLTLSSLTTWPPPSTELLQSFGVSVRNLLPLDFHEASCLASSILWSAVTSQRDLP